jgi:hypothetical protein
MLQAGRSLVLFPVRPLHFRTLALRSTKPLREMSILQDGPELSTECAVDLLIWSGLLAEIRRTRALSYSSLTSLPPRMQFCLTALPLRASRRSGTATQTVHTSVVRVSAVRGLRMVLLREPQRRPCVNRVTSNKY